MVRVPALGCVFVAALFLFACGGRRESVSPEAEDEAAVSVLADGAAEGEGGRTEASQGRGYDQRGSGEPDWGGRRGLAAHRNAVHITGAVKDGTGSGIIGAAVSLWSWSDDAGTTLPWKLVGRVESGRSGKFDLETTASGKFGVTVRKSGFAVSATEFMDPREPGRHRVEGGLFLQLKPELLVSGQVVSAEGVPVAGAQVVGCPPITGAAIGEFITRTDGAGRFVFDGVPEGEFPMAVAAEGAPIQTFPSVAPGEAVVLKFSEPVERLEGKIESESPLPGDVQTTVVYGLANVVHGLRLEREAAVNDAGQFLIEKVAARDGYLMLRTDPPGAVVLDSKERFEDKAAVVVELSDGRSTSVVLKVKTGKTLRGVAVDLESSAPLRGVRLFRSLKDVSAGVNFAETSDDGVFVVPYVTDVSALQVRSDGYYMVDPKGTLPKDVAETVTLVMKPKPWVRGRIVSEVDGGVAGTELEVFDVNDLDVPPLVLSPNIDGYFQSMVGLGSYRFVVNAPGYAMAAMVKEVPAEGLDGIHIRLGRGRKVSGIVLSPDGKPVSGAEVFAQIGGLNEYGGFSDYNNPTGRFGFSPPFKNVITNASGEFDVTGVPADAGLALLARSSDYADSTVYFSESDEGDVDDVKLEFPKSETVIGRVVDELGEPLAGAQCAASIPFLEYAGKSTAVSTTTGAFVLKRLNASQRHSLVVNLDGYQPFSMSITNFDRALSVTLQSMREKVLIVRCLDIATDEPIEAEVTVNNMYDGVKPEVESVKNEPGVYRVFGLKSHGSVYVKVDADKYTSAFKFEELNASLEEQWTFSLRPVGRIIGRVVNEQGEAVADAVVVGSNDKSVPVENDGTFEINNKSEYAGTITAKAGDGRVSDTVTPPVNAGGTVDIGDLVLHGKSVVIVRVESGAGHDPLGGVKVDVKGKNSFSGITNKDGEFSVEIVAGYNVIVELPEYGETRRLDADSIRSGGPNVIIMHVGGGVFRGRLLQEGEPVGGVIIPMNRSLDTEGKRVPVSNRGEFEIRDLSPGKWLFMASTREGRFAANSASVEIEIKGDETVEQDIEIRSEPLRGIVVDERGMPVPDARITFSLEPTVGGNTVSDSDGRFTLPVHDNGILELRAEALPRGRSKTVNLEVKKGETPDIRLVIEESAGRVSCTVLSIFDGLPILNAYASLKSGDGKFVANSNSQSTRQPAVIDTVPTGEYELTVAAPGYSQVQRNVTIEEGRTLEFTDVLSPAAVVNVRVVDAHGFVVEGAAVSLSPLDGSSIESVRTGTSDKYGKVKFQGVLYGRYQVTATGSGGSASAVVSTENQQSTSLNLHL